MLKFLLSRIPQEKRTRKILLIDDDRDIRTVTGLVLMTRGTGTFFEAASGQEGLALAQEHRPDLILLDVGLPDISGETVLQILKADPWTKGIPVIFFTAYANAAERLRNHPVAGVVTKPFSPDELCSAIERAMRGTKGELSAAEGACKPPRQQYPQSAATRVLA